MIVIKRDRIRSCESCCRDSCDIDCTFEGLPDAIKSSVSDLQSFAFGDGDIAKPASNADFFEFLADGFG